MNQRVRERNCATCRVCNRREGSDGGIEGVRVRGMKRRVKKQWENSVSKWKEERIWETRNLCKWILGLRRFWEEEKRVCIRGFRVAICSKLWDPWNVKMMTRMEWQGNKNKNNSWWCLCSYSSSEFTKVCYVWFGFVVFWWNEDVVLELTQKI